jgi:lysozyme
MNLKKQLTSEEGRRAESYRDNVRGIWTIGIGHTGPNIGPGVVWNNAMIDMTFANDVAEKIAEVTKALPWFAVLPGDAADDGTANARQAVLLQMAFQMGTGHAPNPAKNDPGDGLLEFQHTLAAVRDGRWHDAQAGMLQSKWARQTPKRVARLAEQMLTGQWVMA